MANRVVQVRQGDDGSRHCLESHDYWRKKSEMFEKSIMIISMVNVDAYQGEICVGL